MNFARTCRHLFSTGWNLRRVFDAPTLASIEDAIRETEKQHGGEIRFAIENDLDFLELWHDVSPRSRAIDAFAHLRVWDTELNNGVLIYVLWADHDVEIVADRGYREKVGEQQWRAICQQMEKHFAAGRASQACVEGIRAAGQLIAQHFPAADRNELPDRPVFL
ncbi:MAG TPA: TPM domain-containing protein [Povalibacter sp.]|uniref:TPM domain-containing protein n=1 Tax=Povalibacter sp. TaxID=1962978 RepID=UPI002C0AD650|nr:TPM domain-containing protein [Povalibacter sp.]HMN46784.1 TPM domain-containing protein [Povalibacter sp.]